ncbi:MAG: hypothetical protein DDT29_02362 [Dehalococcoidia bacterium]|nr:hypothetical protein [Bacillota bacterium]
MTRAMTRTGLGSWQGHDHDQGQGCEPVPWNAGGGYFIHTLSG